MKRYIYLGLAATGLLMSGMTQSCSTEEPFGAGGEGELRMKMVINSDVTRAETDEEALRENCVVYVSGTKGLLYKYKGLENVPEKLILKSGHYVAEAWTGDSVSASFDKKFFRGYQPFDVQAGVNSVVVNCKIANVVVSINSATIDPAMMKDWKINVANSRGNLDFTEENMDYAKGYFMMPNADTYLTYTVTGTNSEGIAFTHTGKIENPERAHEYVLNVEYHHDYEEIGGSFVTIEIDDSEVLVESEVPLFSRPAIKGVGFEADKQIFASAGKFTDKILKVNAFGGIQHLTLSSQDYADLSLPSDEIDLMNMTTSVSDALKAQGLKWDYTFNDEKNMALSYVTLPATWLNNLKERDTEYVVTLSATDKYGKQTAQDIRIAVGEGAVVIDDPVTIDDVNTSAYMQIFSRRATLTGTIVDGEAATPGIRYREAGTEAWTFVAAGEAATQRAARRKLTPAQATRTPGVAFSVKLTGLKPGTRYEFQAAAGEFASESKFFTTETEFTIPNSSMETWGTYSASVMGSNKSIIFPGTTRENGFWESGNHGSAAAGKVLTNKSTDMVGSGTYSVRLETMSALGIIAAGNLFAGSFEGFEAVTNGILSLGRDYDGSHPDRLSVLVNYRPASGATVKSGVAGFMNGELSAGGEDVGQIYVALTTANIPIHTYEKNRQLFNPDAPEVLAYGQYTFKGKYGPDGQLEKLDIPLTYKTTAKTTKPLKLVIVVAASKYGDYFAGSAGTTMYLDDFQLIYE